MRIGPHEGKIELATGETQQTTRRGHARTAAKTGESETCKRPATGPIVFLAS